MKKAYLKLTLLIFLSIFSFGNYASSEGEITEADVKSAQEFAMSVSNKIINEVKSKNTDKVKQDNIIKVIDNAIEADWISRFVLGRNFQQFNDEQKSKFFKLYREFMINNYGPKFTKYEGNRVELDGSSNKNKFVVVNTTFYQKNNNPIQVSFRVKKINGNLRIVDFIAEGVSLLDSQRSEFNSAINSMGVDKFLNNLESKVNSLKNQK